MSGPEASWITRSPIWVAPCAGSSLGEDLRAEVVGRLVLAVAEAEDGEMDAGEVGRAGSIASAKGLAEDGSSPSP